MLNEHSPFGDHSFELKVREAAYYLWEDAGRPWGRDKEFWYIAFDRLVREREADEYKHALEPTASRLS